MKVLVTGGAGFIGSHIVDLLIEEEHHVVVVDNLTTGERDNVNPEAAFYEVDITHKDFDDVMKKEAPEIIFHQAALVFVQQSMANPISDAEVNVLGTLNVLKSAHENNARKIVFASSCAVYGDLVSLPAKEVDASAPISFYGASKHMAEAYVKLYNQLFNLDYTIFRYGNVYGPRQKHHGEGGVIPIFIENMKKGVTPTIYGDGTQTRDFVHVKDVAMANILAMHKGSQQVINIGSGTGTSVNDLYKMLCEIMRYDMKAQYKPERKGDAKHVSLDPSKAQAILGWNRNSSLLEGLMDTIAFYEKYKE